MSSRGRTVFVTGGSGFIGRALVRRLVSEGATVKALARSPASAAVVEELGATPVSGSLADRDAMAAGAAGCEWAFHLAAHVGAWGQREDFMRENVEGTENALAACRDAGVSRFVHASTEAVLIAGEPLVNVDETAPLRPDSKALYSSTKALAERAVLAANAPGFETVAVRPRFVWGAGDTTLLPHIVGMVREGKFAWIGGGKQRTAVTHVENVVEGLLLGAEKGRGGEAYFVTDGDSVVFREFVSELIRTQGVEPPDRTIPAGLASAAAAAAETAWKLLPLPGEPPLSRFEVWVSSLECTIDISKARRELGYEPIISREEGLAQMREAAAAAA